MKKSDHAHFDPTEDKVFIGESQLPSGRKVTNFKTLVREMKIYNELKKMGRYRSSYRDRAKYDSFEDEFERPDYNEMLIKVWDLDKNYNVNNIYVDGANPEFIRSLKSKIGELSDPKYYSQYIGIMA